jgi:diguanylate cyclase (GGDEF)-like protein
MPHPLLQHYVAKLSRTAQGAAVQLRAHARAFTNLAPPVRNDLIALAAFAAIAYIVSVQFNLFETLTAFLRANESHQADEILTAVLILSIGAIVFAGRRLNESVRDLERRVALEEKARSAAMHDALTGLPNRRKLNVALAEALTVAATGGAVTVIVADLDRFKPVNDLYGHAAGDALLVEVANALREEVGDDGMVARLGGDEFVIVLNDIAEIDALMERLARLSAIFDAPFAIGPNLVSVGATLGAAVAANEATTPEEILRRADVALYRAKQEGRGRFSFFEEAMDARVQERLELERQLREAVASDAITPFYQPLVDLKTSVTYGYEVLSRLRRPDGRDIAPESFIHMAEEIGVIGDLTFNILRRACREARDWPGAPLLSVNISPVQLRDPMLPQKLMQVLTETGFPPGRLQAEITESALVADFDEARAILVSLRNLGVRIALDDFGTGYSSLRHLRELPFDSLKIDRSFVQDLIDNAESQTLVQTIVDLARNLGLKLTAEGIETPTCAQALELIGCETGQGFWFGRPASGETVRRQLIEVEAAREAEALRRESSHGAA